MKDLMKRKGKLFLTYLCLLISFSPLYSQNLLWSDEFNGNSLDTNVWDFALGDGCAEGICGWGNQELQTYTNQNTSVANGYLSITARRENVDGKEFTSARLLTKDKLSVKYGRIEASIKLPDMNNGLWPAFWMLGDANRWPFTGEIDIMEAGFSAMSTDVNNVAKANVFWRAEDAGVTGNLQYGNEDTFKYDALAEAGKQLDDDFFVYRVHWTPDSLTSIILQTDAQGEPIESTAKTIFTIQNSATFENEFFSGDDFFILLNMAVGGWLPFDVNAGENTSANVTALPNAGSEAHMLVDYVRVYDIQGVGTVTAGQVDATPVRAGGLGIYDEINNTAAQLNFGVDAEIFTWEADVAPAMSIETIASVYGDSAYSITFPAAQWAGLGFNSSDVLNLENYSNGSLRFKARTSSQEPFRISAESASGSAGIDFLAGEEKYGLVRDGQWHDVEIPLSLLVNDFKHVYMPLIIGNVEFNEPTTNLTIDLDEIHYSIEPSTKVTKVVPPIGDFGLFTETAVASTFELGTDGDLYVWEETLVEGPTETYNGQAALSYTHNNKGWFGFAFTADELLDLSAFETGYLHIAMKSSATETLEMRINVGLQEDLVLFEAGSDPYGFARDGQWHELEIPLSDFENVNFSNVLQLLSISGAGNISDLAIADVYYKYDGSNTAPTASFIASPTSGQAPLQVQFDASASSDPEGDALTYSWNFGDGATGSGVAVSHTYSTAGNYIATLTVSDGALSDNATAAIAVSEAPACQGAIAIPGQIEAENYTAMQGVDTEGTSDVGGGINVGWIDQGDWLEYFIEVPEAGDYQLDLRLAGAGSDSKTIDISTDGSAKGSLSFGATGGWQNWVTESISVNLSAGCQTLRLTAATSGFNINWLELQGGVFNPVVTTISISPENASIDEGATQPFTAQAYDQNGDPMSASFEWTASAGSIDAAGLYQGTVVGTHQVTVSAGGISTGTSITVNSVQTGVVIPSLIQAEDYSAMMGIQTEATSDAGGGVNVGWIESGDWLDYEVNAQSAGTYQIDVRVAAAGSDAKSFEIYSNGNLLETVSFTATGGWQNWTTVTTSVSLNAGNQTIRLQAVTSGFNINWIEFVEDNSSNTCGGGPESGDYTYAVSEGPALTFEPGYAGVGDNLVLLYYGTNPTGPFPGYLVDVNVPFDLSGVSDGQTVYFYYTYSVPEGGERNTAATPHSFVVGASCAGARSIADASILEEALQLQLYPNPAQDRLQLEKKGSASAVISVMDIAGKSYARLEWAEGLRTYELNIENMKRGLYLLKVESAGEVITRRFLKE
ncbi:carbohydrate-binding protein [Reichenbachiella ulvae]|uniref:Carbohydrate-binding protein n=1 Tax=Reichenbachiella ulvae TaxID=2980104 RepID=A0ABT3CUK0_9BACT|nr:carbohydrate-binding protein [Reichenbachiella ulvae]MCV9387256.1 carbohydrate-binding protein [Reichenbachiella ulvae]